MSFYNEGIQKSQVMMLPDGTEEWERAEIDVLDAVFYRSPACTDELAELVLRAFASGEVAGTEPFMGGAFSRVYPVGDSAIKVAKDQRGSAYIELSLGDAIVNLGLNVGLSRAEMAVEVDGIALAAPQLYGIVTANQSDIAAVPLVYAMDLAPGTGDFDTEIIPKSSKTSAEYYTALKRCNIAYDDVLLDNRPRNMVVEYSEDQATIERITKFDVQAKNWYRPQL